MFNAYMVLFLVFRLYSFMPLYSFMSGASPSWRKLRTDDREELKRRSLKPNFLSAQKPFQNKSQLLLMGQNNSEYVTHEVPGP